MNCVLTVTGNTSMEFSAFFLVVFFFLLLVFLNLCVSMFVVLLNCSVQDRRSSISIELLSVKASSGCQARSLLHLPSFPERLILPWFRWFLLQQILEHTTHSTLFSPQRISSSSCIVHQVLPGPVVKAIPLMCLPFPEGGATHQQRGQFCMWVILSPSRVHRGSVWGGPGQLADPLMLTSQVASAKLFEHRIYFKISKAGKHSQLGHNFAMFL